MKSIRSLSTQFLLLGLAVGFAWVLPKIGWVRDSYSIHLYPILQSMLTGISNRIPFALFDVVVGLAIVALLLIWAWSLRSATRRRSIRPVGRGLLGSALLLTVVYVWILFAWGLNYARPPLERSVAYDAARITPAALRSLAERAVDEANRSYDAAHAAGFQSIDAVPSRLADAVRDVSRELGHPPPRVFARPKRSMFSPYFRASGVSGMLAPFFLETLLNPDLTGPERPYTLAHEWAHLSGFAPESDAGFVGILAALRADPPSRYSAWLALVSEAASQLPRSAQSVVLKELAAGPRSDQAAINERLRALIPQVERAAWATYDQALKSQGVAEGVDSYSRVVQLLLGTDALKISS